MLRAYRLIITNNPCALENLWETEQPYIDNLSRSARTFGYHMKQRFFLRHTELLDAAHIIPDSEEEGTPQVSNGLSLCKLHHAAFDRFLLGITPDYVAS